MKYTAIQIFNYSEKWRRSISIDIEQ